MAAQIQSPSQASEDDTAQSDVDPTRPVFFSIRPEFYTLAHGAEQRVLVFRTDAAVLKTQRFFSGLPGVILRFEAPVVGSDANGQHAFGVGDAYGQFLVIPYVNATKTFAWLFGTGVVLPTGTDMLTGGGKWVVAPMGIPLWRFANSLFYIKVQNFTSVAGDAARPDLNYLLVSPLFFRKMAAGWWVVADSDIKTIWTDDGRTNVRTGFLLGHGLVPGVSIWVKPEIWWGPNPDIRRAVRFGIVWYTRRAAPPAGATP
ncbi:MAG TPA: hypothetical protein VFA27_04335 [Vicinamibacterales bacterium]|nr:hypothetical protein [Vicinamibacterales bacterium]